MENDQICRRQGSLPSFRTHLTLWPALGENRLNTISVIIPCFNAEAYIGRSIASALGQTLCEIEVIVVNDGSTDRSLQIATGVKDTRFKIINQSNRGVSAARNRGVSEATGTYVAFLDADDTWRPDCLEKLYSALKFHANAALAYCGWQNLGLPGGKGKPYIPPDYEGPAKLETLLWTCPWPIHAVLTRRGLIFEAGGFDESLSNAEDYQLWLRIASRYEVTRVPEVLAFYHFHEGPQATKNKARAARDNWLVKKEFLRTYPELADHLGQSRIRQLVHGMLLKRGYECYWARDLDSARRIFRLVMSTGYGTLSDWKYMLPALLPLSLHRNLICLLERNGQTVS